MRTGRNQSITLTKYMTCKWECKLDGKKFDMNQKWNNCRCEYKNLKEHCVCKKVIFGILQYVTGKMVNIQEALVIQ